MPRSQVILGLAFALGFAGCGGKQSRSTEPAPVAEVDAGGTTVEDEAAREAMLAPLVERHRVAVEEMATVVERTLGDCPAMAKALGELMQARAALFEDIARAEADPDNGPVLAKLHRPSRARTDALSELIGKGVATCADDPEMRAVVDAMPFR